MRFSRRKFIESSAALGLSGAIGGCIHSESPEEQIEAHRESYQEIRDIGSAVDAGYQSVGRHVHTEEGGMGEVLRNESFPIKPDIGDLDPDRPNLLFYRLTEDGGYEPMGVGWYVSTDNTDEPPEMFGMEFEGPFSEVFPDQGEHYVLNAWVFDENPVDLFTRYHSDLSGPSFVDELRRVREATRVYTDYQDAASGGYTEYEAHASTDEGLYGVPFIDYEQEEIDLERPNVLLYYVTPTWVYRLMAVEWYVDADSVDEPPELMGQRFHESMEKHSDETEQPRHYGLHAWIHIVNPMGMFEPFNPSIVV